VEVDQPEQADQRQDQRHHYRKVGHEGLIVRPATFEGVIGAAFNPIRHAGRDHARVLRRLTQSLAVLAGFARDQKQREAIARQAAAMDTACREAALDPLGRGEVEHSLEALRRALADVASD
jgi:uncharacterized membrane protein